MGGDFNSILHAKDSATGNGVSPQLKNLIQNAKLVDTWEKIHRNDVEYSFIRSNSGSRIDRIYVDQSLRDNIIDAKLQVNCFTDHKASIIRLKLPKCSKTDGRGIWTCRTEALDDEILAELQTKWIYWTSRRRFHRSWMDWWTAFAKPKLISFLKWKSSIKFKSFHDTMEYYYFCLKRCYDDFDNNANQMQNINKI